MSHELRKDPTMSTSVPPTERVRALHQQIRDTPRPFVTLGRAARLQITRTAFQTMAAVLEHAAATCRLLGQP